VETPPVTHSLIAGAIALAALQACGNDSSSGFAQDASLDSGGSGGSTAGDGSAGAAGGFVDCSGNFGSVRRLIHGGTQELSSPALPRDELELFYTVAEPGGTNERFMRSSRASTSQAFSPGEPVVELDAACASTETLTLDLSADGLRAYVTCHSVFTAGPLILLRRETRTSPFARVGTVAVEVGASAALSSDELTIYSTGVDAVPERASPLVATRESTADPFGSPSPLSGLEGTGVLAPDLSPDELTLFGGLKSTGRVIVTERVSKLAPFGQPDVVSLPPAVAGAPHLSADCRRLYFVGIDPRDGGGTDWALYIAER
jgi:hypothetical protein